VTIHQGKKQLDLFSDNPAGIWRWCRGFLSAILLIAPAILLYGLSIGFDTGLTLRVLGYAILSSLGGVLLPLRGTSKIERIFLGLLIGATLVSIGERYARVSDYPFSMGWSEGNHFWNNSLFFIRDQYQVIGEHIIPNYVTLGISLLRGLPYLISDRSIALHRMWEATLWIVPSLILGWTLTHRWRTKMSWKHIAFLLWSYLFLAQGPIYPPLIVATTLVVLLTDRNKLARTAAVVFIASLFAGLGRWTWMVAPAAYAILIMMLEDRELEISITEYIRKRVPSYLAIGVFGLVGGLLSQGISVLVTHRPPFIYLGSMNHPLLWDRLFPNPTFAPGILLGLLVAVGPLILLLIWVFASMRGRLHLVSTSLIILMGVVLLIGGVVVSVKIGAGGDLHDLDMFLIFLLILANDGVRRIIHGQLDRPELWPEFPRGLALIAFATPILWTVATSQDVNLPPPGAGVEELQIISREVEKAAQEGDILFIEERQLLAFGFIDDVPLVPEYELVEVMDHAMAGDEAYFSDFYQDLEARRFSLIIASGMSLEKHRVPHSFEEEGEAWRKYVAVKLFDWYSPAIKLDDVGVWLYKPVTGIED
jgi:hypothetical protein